MMKYDYMAPMSESFSLDLEINLCGTNDFQGSKNEKFSNETDLNWGDGD